MVRSVGPKFIAIILLVHVIQSIVVNQVFFRFDVFLPIENATSGLINATLIANLFSMLIVFTVLFRFSALKPKDVSLKFRGGDDGSLVRGVSWTVVALLVFHFATLIAIAAMGKPVAFFDWLSSNGMKQVGIVLSQFFGNALYEEVLFRGFLLPQMVLVLKKRWRKWSWTKCFWLGIVGSQLIFALCHIPNRIAMGTYASANMFLIDMLVLFVCGVLFAAVFMLTRSLFAAVGVHAIVNAAPALVEVPIVGLSYTAFFIIPLAIVWNRKVKAKK